MSDDSKAVLSAPCPENCGGGIVFQCAACGVDMSTVESEVRRGQKLSLLSALNVALHERDAYLKNLTDVQRRCTELLETNRSIASKMWALEEEVRQHEKQRARLVAGVGKMIAHLRAKDVPELTIAELKVAMGYDDAR